MRISVIIPTYNDDVPTLAHAKGCAAACPAPDELIVVNDGGPETLHAPLAALNLPVRTIYARILKDIVFNQPGARNLGAVLSRGDILAFEDAEYRPKPDAYGCLQSLFLGNPALQRVRETMMGGTFAIRRLAFCGVGMFDESFSGSYGEDDADLHWRCDMAHQMEQPPPSPIYECIHERCHAVNPNSRNRQMLEGRRKRPRANTYVLRFPYRVEVIKE